MNFTKFISTPLSSVVCATCVQWGGARVIRDGLANTCSSFLGKCKSASYMFECDDLHVMKKKANHADCKYWVPIKTDSGPQPKHENKSYTWRQRN